jgi:alpha-N-arabinofuranosidase
MRIACALVPLALLATSSSGQGTPALHIDPHVVISPVSPMLYGLMTEEINYSYDGGLYAEMIHNRTFQHTWGGFEHWEPYTRGSGHVTVSDGKDGPSDALPKSLQLKIAAAGKGSSSGLANDGFWGMAVRPDTAYHGSFYAKAAGVGPATLQLLSDHDGSVLAETTVDTVDGSWRKYDFGLHTGQGISASQRNHFALTFARPGTIELQLVSLFPPTYHERANGNRPDLMERMAALQPHFLRFPGGNYLEGDTVNERFDWKKTVGPLVDRPTHRGPWNYQSSDGMGLLEFLEWCEDLKMEPLLAVYAGYSLKGEHLEGPALAPYIQDALDEIEYVTGDAATKWGAVRARAGHPAPFPLRYIEVGNEDENDASHSYDRRFTKFADAIRAKYPQYKLIATTPVKSGNPDLIDDHYYKLPDEFFDFVHHYDKADRHGPKIFVGEWATRTGSPTPDFGAALGDAAWMTAMERNSDLIVMASYAPLLVNVNPGGMQWSADLIGFDALRTYASPSYWAQVLFNEHLGSRTVQTKSEGLGTRMFWSATLSPDRHMLYLKMVNASEQSATIQLSVDGVKPGIAKGVRLHALSRFDTNSMANPDNIAPTSFTVSIPQGVWSYTLAGNSIEVVDIPLP